MIDIKTCCSLLKFMFYILYEILFDKGYVHRKEIMLVTLLMLVR